MAWEETNAKTAGRPLDQLAESQSKEGALSQKEVCQVDDSGLTGHIEVNSSRERSWMTVESVYWFIGFIRKIFVDNLIFSITE